MICWKQGGLWSAKYIMVVVMPLRIKCDYARSDPFCTTLEGNATSGRHCRGRIRRIVAAKTLANAPIEVVVIDRSSPTERTITNFILGELPCRSIAQNVVELFLAEFGMAHYRVCTIGLDGHFLSVEEIECANDQKAIQKAQQAVDDRDVELWQGDRFIVRLSPKPTTE